MLAKANVYTKEMESTIKKMYSDGSSYAEIADVIGYSKRAIISKIQQMKAKGKITVSEYEKWQDKFIKENMDKLSITEIARHTGLAYTTVSGKIVSERRRTHQPFQSEYAKFKNCRIMLEIKQLDEKMHVGKKYRITEIRKQERNQTHNMTATLIKKYGTYYHFRGPHYDECFQKTDFLTGEYNIKRV